MKMFLAFDGGEGVGKTTTIGYVKAALEQRGETVELVHEPGGTEVGQDIRELLLKKPYSKKMDNELQILLFAASRLALVEQKIIPFLQAGKTVIADRFLASNLVYQGADDPNTIQRVFQTNAYAVSLLQAVTPVQTLIVDLPGEIAHQRVNERVTKEGKAKNFFDEMSVAEYETTRQAFLHIPDQLQQAAANFNTPTTKLVADYLHDYHVYDAQPGSKAVAKAILQDLT